MKKIVPVKGFYAAGLLASLLLFFPIQVIAQSIFGQSPRLGPSHLRVSQFEIESGYMELLELRKAGLKIFTTTFNKYDGYGDGPMDSFDPTTPGGRPTMQNNGTFLRVNGLDGQTCQECHGFVSTASTPPILGIGGFGGINNSAMFKTQNIDIRDTANNGFAAFDGRLINPPHLYGVGGVQLVAREMTRELAQKKVMAVANPGVVVSLDTKGVHFGTIVADEFGNVDTSRVEGIDPDLVVRPFGRKGEFSSVRKFDLDAMMFHFGMQPVEVVGVGVDGDGDGVTDEVLPGEISALEIFLTTSDRPRKLVSNQEAQRGLDLFKSIGCAECHIPSFTTEDRFIKYALPEVEDDPDANVFYEADLSRPPARFQITGNGGLKVPLFSDLKRHDMGPELCEDFSMVSEQRNREFITPKLWAVADTAPYLHDGRALTLHEAILMLGGEAEPSRNAYESLTNEQKNDILMFLMTLRTPVNPHSDVQEAAEQR